MSRSRDEHAAGADADPRETAARLRSENDRLRKLNAALAAVCRALLAHGAGGGRTPGRAAAWDRAVAAAEAAIEESAGVRVPG
jgi:hypothetical protein